MPFDSVQDEGFVQYYYMVSSYQSRESAIYNASSGAKIVT